MRNNTNDTAPSSDQRGRGKVRKTKCERAYRRCGRCLRRRGRRGGEIIRQTINKAACDCPSSSVPSHLTWLPCSRPETPRALAVAPGPSDPSDPFDPSASAATGAALAAAAAARSQARMLLSAVPSSSSPPSPYKGRSFPCAPCPSYPGPRTYMCPAPRLALSAMVPCQTPLSTRCAALYGIANSGCTFLFIYFMPRWSANVGGIQT